MTIVNYASSPTSVSEYLGEYNYEPKGNNKRKRTTNNRF